jgi:hypothetical protein
MVTLGVDPNDPVGPPPDRVARLGRDDDLSFQLLKRVAAIKAGEATGMFRRSAPVRTRTRSTPGSWS